MTSSLPPSPLPSPLRNGPRPLPLHLMAQASTLFSSWAVLPSWRSGSFAWKPHLAPEAERLARDIDSVGDEAFKSALTAESRHRVDAFLAGVEAYRRHPYRRAVPEVPELWREGTTRLLDFRTAGASGPPVLVVPSLINRSYIVDLSPRRSLMRSLAARGLRPFLVDWGAPGPGERDFGLDDYIAGRLSRLLDVVVAEAGRPAVVGYCMGGLLALGLGLLRQDAVRGVGLLATPWDFHQPNDHQGRKVAALRPVLEATLDVFGELPLDTLQAMFAAVDPGSIERKFRNFGQLKMAGARARDFVALEDWLNDGVPLTAGVARQTLFDWYVDNLPARSAWRLGGQVIAPKRLVRPALVMVPSKDRIVPPASALALAGELAECRVKVVDSGHIGMVTGARAGTDVYAVLAKWLHRLPGV